LLLVDTALGGVGMVGGLIVDPLPAGVVAEGADVQDVKDPTVAIVADVIIAVTGGTSVTGLVAVKIRNTVYPVKPVKPVYQMKPPPYPLYTVMNPLNPPKPVYPAKSLVYRGLIVDPVSAAAVGGVDIQDVIDVTVDTVVDVVIAVTCGTSVTDFLGGKSKNPVYLVKPAYPLKLLKYPL